MKNRYVTNILLLMAAVLVAACGGNKKTAAEGGGDAAGQAVGPAFNADSAYAYCVISDRAR